MMLFLVNILIFLGVLLVLWRKNDRELYNKHPPGPLRLPLIGSLLTLLYHGDNHPGKAFKQLADIYGDIMFIKVGGFEAIVCTSPDTIHEMLSHEKASKRFVNELFKDRHVNQNIGIGWAWGQTWHDLRRFSLRTLRDFGFGKSTTMDVVINEEIEKFHAFLQNEAEKSRGRIIHVEDLFSMTVINNLWRLVSGKSYDLDDPKIWRWVHLNNEWFKTIRIGMDISDSYPWLRDWFPNWTGRTAQKEIYKELYKYGQDILDIHRNVKVADSEPETFVDAFIQKIEAAKADPNSNFNDVQFVFTILDLFGGGSETSSNTLNFGILYMLIFPEVQEKVQAEIDREIPSGILIDSSMKSKLPYTCATVLEIFRYSTIIPIIAPREATEEFYFRGYLIKKGTALMSNIYTLSIIARIYGAIQETSVQKDFLLQRERWIQR